MHPKTRAITETRPADVHRSIQAYIFVQAHVGVCVRRGARTGLSEKLKEKGVDEAAG